MRKFLVLSVMMMFVAAVSMAATNPSRFVEPLPQPLDNGGPDTYGYSWEDNDGGGPLPYNWIDITGNGVQVIGLADDNNIGPIPIGFQFPYYWYTVDHMWIGSNGYISFSSNANFAHPFASIPATTLPNDLVAVLTGDLDFTRPGALCYYYTNHADTFIVSWIDVPQFSNDHSQDDSTHTFQLILSAADSSLKFQYGENHGNFAEGGNLADVIGIEDEVGRVGLEYLEENLPSNHMWHNGLALRFHPVPDPNFVFHDFGVVDGFQEGSGAPYVHVDSSFIPRAHYKNFGTRAEDNLRVRCLIRRGSASVYDVSDTIPHLEPSEQLWLDFPSAFTPDRDTVYRVTFSATLTGDQNSANNSRILELDSYELPQDIRYDDNGAETGRSWNGDFSGFGVEFQVPEPVTIDIASFNVNTVTASGPAYVWIMPDSAGRPDVNHILAGDTITVTTAGWQNINFGWANLQFGANAKFYLVALHAFQTTFDFAMDQSPPLAYRGWEYTGGMAPDRDRGVSDIMFKVHADVGTGVSEEITPKSFSLSQNYPNPFNARTNIAFELVRSSDVSIGIYNIAGQLVGTINGRYPAGSNIVTWDASRVSSGVYFYRMTSERATETRKMVLIK